MQIELVIFDMDGLMFDTETLCCRCWSRALRELGFEPDHQLYLKSVGVSSGSIYSDFYGPSLDMEQLSALTRKYMKESILKNGLPIKQGLPELLQRIGELHLKKAIASSSPREEILNNLEVTRINNDFDYIISGKELARGKPFPDIFINVCDQLDIPRENAVVLEDSLNGLRAAHAGGIRCIIIPDMIPANAEIKEKAFKIYDSLADVIGFLDNNTK